MAKFLGDSGQTDVPSRVYQGPNAVSEKDQTVHAEADLKLKPISVAKHADWDLVFMMLAMTVSLRAKDPNTQVGCVIVDKNKTVTIVFLNVTTSLKVSGLRLSQSATTAFLYAISALMMIKSGTIQ